MSQVKQQRRRLVRRTRQHPSWITIEGDIRSHECEVMDVSADGAKLIADIEARVGSKFRLSVVPEAVVRREYEVVWRRGHTIGVRFAAQVRKTH
jgi:hypothetical protein